MIKSQLHYREESDYLYFLDQAEKEWGAQAFVTAHYNDVVYLPDTQTGLMQVIVDAMPVYQGTSLKEIDVGVYDELKSLYRVDDHANFDLTANWYARWASENGGQLVNRLSNKSWLKLYEFLTREAGFSLDDMVQELPRIGTAWKQGLPVDALDDLNISYGSNLADEKLLELALASLTADETSHLASMYKDEDGQVTLVYSIG